MTDEIYSLISEDNLADLMNVCSQTPPGCIVEVGVYQGGSAYALSILAKAQHRQLHLFDTFTGMPESSEIDKHPVGDFSDTSLEMVKEMIPDAFFHVGMFPQTMPPQLHHVAFAHIDCDNYESVKACCMYLPIRMVQGGVMYFDDYGILEGATKAVDECMPHRIRLANGKAMVIVP